MYSVVSKTRFRLPNNEPKSWRSVYIMNTLRQKKSTLISITRARQPHSAVFNKMSSPMNYNEAIDALNGLQSNFHTIQEIKLRIQKSEQCTNIKDVWKYLTRIGITPNILKNLSVIHVAGTKGKGTTSALCESILHKHGYKTGFFSSPHLISVNERIRLNGQSIDKDLFATSFNNLYGELQKTQEYVGDMPRYFTFLTIMAFQVFLQQNVDVAIIEVGIGGKFDCTNVVNNVPVAGITSLGLEHTSILGNTIEEIAAEKGGILKPNCQAFTVHQPEAAMKVLSDIANLSKCSLKTIPEYDEYTWEMGSQPILSTNMPTHKINASLAIQLAHSWMRHKCSMKPKITTLQNGNVVHTEYSNDNLVLNTNKKFNDSNGNLSKNVYNGELSVPDDICDNCFIKEAIPFKTSKGLSECFWPGRCQILKCNDVDYYIDGAHTLESIKVCTEWFAQHSRNNSKKYLMFNATGDRDSDSLLKLLIPLDFQMALFVPNIAFDTTQCADQINIKVCLKQQIDRCSLHVNLWDRNCINDSKNTENLAEKALGFSSISAAINYVKKGGKNDPEKPQVLVTGSLHLVGNILSILDPDLSESHQQIINRNQVS